MWTENTNSYNGPVGGYDFYRSDRVRDIRYREDVKHGLLPGHTIGDICSR